MESGRNKSKLRGTESSSRSRTGYVPDSSKQTHSATSSQNTVHNTASPNQIEPHKTNSVRRGIAIQQMLQSTTTDVMSKSTDLSYSNESIENYFRNIQEQKKREIHEENVKTWGKMLHSIKKS